MMNSRGKKNQYIYWSNPKNRLLIKSHFKANILLQERSSWIWCISRAWPHLACERMKSVSVPSLSPLPPLSPSGTLIQSYWNGHKFPQRSRGGAVWKPVLHPSAVDLKCCDFDLQTSKTVQIFPWFPLQDYLYALCQAKLAVFCLHFALCSANFSQWKLRSWLLTVCPIPSACMVALCTRSKPWPVTVIVLPPLWHTNTNTQAELNSSRDKRMSNSLWYANTVGYCTKTTEKQASHMSSKKNTATTHMLCCSKDNSEERLHIRRTLLWGFMHENPQSSSTSRVLSSCLWCVHTWGSSWWVRWTRWWDSFYRCSWC